MREEFQTLRELNKVLMNGQIDVDVGKLREILEYIKMCVVKFYDNADPEEKETIKYAVHLHCKRTIELAVKILQDEESLSNYKTMFAILGEIIPTLVAPITLESSDMAVIRKCIEHCDRIKKGKDMGLVKTAWDLWRSKTKSIPRDPEKPFEVTGDDKRFLRSLRIESENIPSATSCTALIRIEEEKVKADKAGRIFNRNDKVFLRKNRISAEDGPSEIRTA